MPIFFAFRFQLLSHTESINTIVDIFNSYMILSGRDTGMV